jgi:hypothetical protein
MKERPFEDNVQSDSEADPLNDEETSVEAKESKIDYWEMKSIMRGLGFTEVSDHPAILNSRNRAEMKDQDMIIGRAENAKGEDVITVWRDGMCWARRGKYSTEALEKALGGRTLKEGALQPPDWDFEHTNIES